MTEPSFDVDAFLARPLTARLATNGPTVRPVWFLWEEGAFWIMTGPWAHWFTRMAADAHERAFGEATAADDRLHREANSLVSDLALMETQYLGFSMPEANIHALNYTWLHPNIGTASRGAWVWQGTKPGQHSSEIFELKGCA